MNGKNQIVALYNRILAAHGELSVWFVTDVGDGEFDDFRQLIEVQIDHDDHEVCHRCKPADHDKPAPDGWLLSRLVGVLQSLPATCEGYKHVEIRSIHRVVDGATYSRADFPIKQLKVDAGRLYCIVQSL